MSKYSLERAARTFREVLTRNQIKQNWGLVEVEGGEGALGITQFAIGFPLVCIAKQIVCTSVTMVTGSRVSYTWRQP